MKVSILKIIQRVFRHPFSFHNRMSKRWYSEHLYRSIVCFIAMSISMVNLPLTHAMSDDILSEYETYLPNTAKDELERSEKKLLKAYLDSPNDAKLAKRLAINHILQTVKGNEYKLNKGEILQHTIMTQYFLHRAKSLGSVDRWVDKALGRTQKRLHKLVNVAGPNSTAEDHSAHDAFREAFHYKEQNRYMALAKLLDDFVADPNNVYTAFALTAINLWIGGEADYDDPTVVYNFVLGSYFSLRAIDLARQLEGAWLADPSQYTRFRMATILGGFTALHRRWLASLHGDQQALAAINDEHREWRLIHRSFHAFTVGIPFFEEESNFQEGLFAVIDGFAHCEEVPVRTCSNLPRFSFNRLSFVLTLVDFLIKAGDIEAAEQALLYRFDPSETDYWAAWDLGRDAWEHRENHLLEIFQLYQNDDPSDDPLHFQLKRRKWGTNTTTCQTCHQTQSKVWSKEEFNTIILPPEEVATVGLWPKVSTTWYGELSND